MEEKADYMGRSEERACHVEEKVGHVDENAGCVDVKVRYPGGLNMEFHSPIFEGGQEFSLCSFHFIQPFYNGFSVPH